MSDPRWKRVHEIFQAALERPEEERTAFVQEACSERPDLLTEVVSLLAADAEEHPLLDGAGME